MSNSSLALQLQQAFLHSQVNCNRSVSLLSDSCMDRAVDRSNCVHIPERFGVSSAQHEEIHAYGRLMEGGGGWDEGLIREEEVDPPVDPVLSYITEMLMEEEMEDRPCMFMESSAYRTMAEELAGLLVDPSALEDQPFCLDRSSSSYGEDDGIDQSPSRRCSTGDLFDGISRSPLTTEMTEFVDGDGAEMLHGNCTEQQSMFHGDCTEQRNSVKQTESENKSWMCDQRTGDGGYSEDRGAWPSCAQSLGYSSSSSLAGVPAQHHHDQRNGSLDRELGLNGDPAMAAGGGGAGKKLDLFMMLQKSVASHVGNAKTKAFHRQKQEKGSSRHAQMKTINGRSEKSRSTAKYTARMDRAFRDGERLAEVAFERQPSPWLGGRIEGVDRGGGDEKASVDEGGEGEKEDLIELLKKCALHLTRDDMLNANRAMRMIRQEATPVGDGTQRLAFYFAEGLVARMSGAGACLYAALDNNPPSAAEMLRAYHLRIENCPFIRICHFFSNQTFVNACDGETRLHVVDYGILYGFQWLSLIQALASRQPGPPHLRITGIDLPQPGFKPAERVEETGKRLSDYARAHGVPFEYQAMAASRWEDILPSSLSLRHDEILVVNCMFRLRHLLDETVMADSPRKKLLSRIRSIKPKVLVVAVVNAGYNAPFGFLPRFQEALAHFHSIYDAIDSCVRRDNPDRLLLEREIFGREILNVVACEGLERVERAEQYKHWQSRTQKAGFEMLPLCRNICNRAKVLMQQYHADYSLSIDDAWLKLAWRGRYSRCVSAWRCR